MEIKQIIDGWLNLAFTDEQIEELSNERMEVCNGCPFKKKMLKIDCCSLCHCPLVAKTRSPESTCPKGYWKDKK